uniref:Methyltransferase FkbM domain-containing protein n=1 Tax=viral metagenome TaxID=1070528 RepID=A0A6C0LDQ1_9ZZZZ
MKYLLQKISFFNYKDIIMNIFNYNEALQNTIELDIISKCLEHDGCWEPYQTEISKEILKDGNNIFIDIGSHLGYYSLLASTYNNQVISIDCNETYINLFQKSITENNIENIKIYNKLVNKEFSLDTIIDINSYIKLIKCDIEGYEIEFINSILVRLEQNKIENLIIEISPELRNNYSEYIMKIKKFGYFIYDLGLSPQRKLNSLTTLKSLNMININSVENMKYYISNLPEKQSNFLFSTKNYLLL